MPNFTPHPFRDRNTVFLIFRCPYSTADLTIFYNLLCDKGNFWLQKKWVFPFSVEDFWLLKPLESMPGPIHIKILGASGN